MITNSLPKAFLDNLKRTFLPEQIDQILEGLSSNRPTTFRVNTLKTTAEKVSATLDELEINYQIIDWPENVFILQDEKRKLIETTMYAEGLIYLQSLASLLPPLILHPQPNQIVLDLTAAPGSKTTQIAAIMNNTGKIIANDRHLIRLEKLKYNLTKQGVKNVEVFSLQGQGLGQRFPNKFDKTLLDAPCSLEGTFDINNPKSFQNWSEDLVEALSLRQKDLLLSAYKATKPGGTIVYSTCTINTQENEEVINWLFEKTDGKIILETIDLEVPESVPGFTKIKNKELDDSIKNTLRILPSPLFEGFYLAKIKKIT